MVLTRLEAEVCLKMRFRVVTALFCPSCLRFSSSFYLGKNGLERFSVTRTGLCWALLRLGVSIELDNQKAQRLDQNVVRVNLASHCQFAALLAVVKNFSIVRNVQASFVIEANRRVAEISNDQEAIKTIGLTAERNNRLVSSVH